MPRGGTPNPAVDPDRRWHAWKTLHPREAEDPRAAWHAAWTAGGWAAIHQTSQLGALVERLDEVITLYRTAEIEHEIAASAYWRSEARP
jgi:hypothetical protein